MGDILTEAFGYNMILLCLLPLIAVFTSGQDDPYYNEQCVTGLFWVDPVLNCSGSRGMKTTMKYFICNSYENVCSQVIEDCLDCSSDDGKIYGGTTHQDKYGNIRHEVGIGGWDCFNKCIGNPHPGVGPRHIEYSGCP